MNANSMSYKVEIVDEYSFGRSFSHPLRFATETEAEAYSNQFCHAGWDGIQDLRVVASDEPLNACWTEKGILNKDGQPFCHPSRQPTSEEIHAEANRLGAKWDALVRGLG
ncbi:MAG TPA: hypothetical protein VF123_19770 [Candidatus Sulfotelmatobacter sp.]